MKLRSSLGGFALLAALAARAGEPAAPLENTKQELKALPKSGQSTQPDGPAVGKLREAMPQLQMPAEPRLFDPAAAGKSEAELKKKKDAQKNWLLNGMDRLDRNAKSPGRDDKALPGDQKAEDETPDPGDPGYFLKLYSEQQKRAEARAEAKQSSPATADPLRPFLQGWLSESPVRGRFFDEFTKKTEAGAGGIGVATPLGETHGGTTGPGGETSGLGMMQGGRGPAAAPGANPYLQGLDLPALQDLGSHPVPAGTPPAFLAAPTPVPAPRIEPAPMTRPPEKKAPASTLADDKKYFPQLKRF